MTGREDCNINFEEEYEHKLKFNFNHYKEDVKRHIDLCKDSVKIKKETKNRDLSKNMVIVEKFLAKINKKQLAIENKTENVIDENGRVL